MTVLPRNSQKSTSELFRSTAPAIFFRCSSVSFGLAIALSSSEATRTGLSGLDSQRIRSFDRTMYVSYRGPGRVSR